MPISPPSLAELQHAFAGAIAAGAAPALEPWIAARGIAPGARLRIYRNANLAIHVDALATSYPALQRLLGADCFDGLATRHAAYRGSRSGNLQEYGADFADFLAAQPETAAWPWLGEVARLEWLRQQVALAADEPPADAAALIAACADPSQTLHLRPCVRVLSSAWAVLELWRYAQENLEETSQVIFSPLPPGEGPGERVRTGRNTSLRTNPLPAAATLSRRERVSPTGAVDPAVPQSVLLWREGGQVAMRALAPAQTAFVRALRHAASLDLALAAAQLIDAQVTPETLLLPLLEHALLAA